MQLRRLVREEAFELLLLLTDGVFSLLEVVEPELMI